MKVVALVVLALAIFGASAGKYGMVTGFTKYLNYGTVKKKIEFE